MRKSFSGRAARAFGAGCASTLMLIGWVPEANAAWISGNVRLNLRSGAGNDYRILGNLETGDEVEVLERGKRWTRIRSSDGTVGYIPGGYLEDDAPAEVRAKQLEAEVAELTSRLTSTEGEAKTLRTQNEALSGNDSTQETEIDRLTLENAELKAGARWPEWITGAFILSTGMALGAILRGLAGRGRRQRIKL